jgi:hypothetical protein
MPQSRLSPGLVAAELTRVVARFERSATVSLIDHDEFGVPSSAAGSHARLKVQRQTAGGTGAPGIAAARGRRSSQ